MSGYANQTPGGRYAFKDATLTAVIQHTEDAINQMGRVNAGVYEIVGQLSMVNRSTSGVQIGTNLTDWVTTFEGITNEIKDLHRKAQALLTQNRAVELETGQASSGAQSG